jgi:hypothetical protein
MKKSMHVLKRLVACSTLITICIAFGRKKYIKNITYPSTCLPCEYAAEFDDNSSYAMVMTSTAGNGRTGNYAISIMKAMYRAYACKSTLVLPSSDAVGGLFQDAPRFFDFTFRDGNLHPNCSSANGLTGDAKPFFNLPPFPPPMYDARLLTGCVQLYLGICKIDFCRGLEHLHDKLVVHIRQGDIFKTEYNPNVHRGYGQPPLSYYLAAMSFQRWKEVIVVGEQTNDTSPIWSELHVMQNVSNIPIVFQSQSWHEDFRTLMCAMTLVPSYSTLNQVLLLGRSTRYFFWRCFESHKLIYKIDISGNYTPFSYHDNSPKEWVTMLLHESSIPQQC